MVQPNYEAKNRFLYPCDRYHGKFQPNNLVFNANLQEFAQRVSYIANLETAGKLSPEIAFTQIEALWKQLADSKNKLGIGSDISV
ncbi:hypothetical protein [Nostoc sp. NMS4]|uniref:DUF7219 family protein n=1 Tax=Nostoc sp. NMS4 TaxID=2815390 RepID=UPI0025E23B68|nr:hypothetical protein [Nostoc sp. NMS4]MBN3922445.1 hypothetical protein [Nostoc sp. NMS4]